MTKTPDAGTGKPFAPRTPEPCGAIGAMTIAGREVAAFTCELDRGHEVFGVDHHASIEWTDATIDAMPDADLFDPDERFDVTVPAPIPALDPHDTRFGEHD